MFGDEKKKEIALLAEEFKASRKLLLALGDENRQHIILKMMTMDTRGVRVGAIAEKSHLSRPAVSHHLQILKDAGILRVRREGTKNFYYFDAGSDALGRLIHMLQLANDIMRDAPKTYTGK